MYTKSRRLPKLPVYVGSFLLLVVLAGLSWFLVQRQHAARTWAAYQQLMALTPLSATPTSAAPDFTLRDQNGKTVQLAALQGKIVVLEFMDPVCTDICPIVSAEIRQADAELGAKASQVEFIAVNVNQYHEAQRDVMAFSRQHGLSALPNWHFVTGSTAALQRVWKAYGITVVPNPTGDVEHSSFMFFINKQGNEAYVANPADDKATIAKWGSGIQTVVSRMLT